MSRKNIMFFINTSKEKNTNTLITKNRKNVLKQTPKLNKNACAKENVDFSTN
jgi:hypothetical protein